MSAEQGWYAEGARGLRAAPVIENRHFIECH